VDFISNLVVRKMFQKYSKYVNDFLSNLNSRNVETFAENWEELFEDDLRGEDMMDGFEILEILEMEPPVVPQFLFYLV
jgi:restriction endonuclease S subunit